jgi:hypothetical protein
MQTRPSGAALKIRFQLLHPFRIGSGTLAPLLAQRGKRLVHAIQRQPLLGVVAANVGDPLKAMCSKMCANPVIPLTSPVEPTPACVIKLAYGAGWRSSTRNVIPFFSVKLGTRDGTA